MSTSSSTSPTPTRSSPPITRLDVAAWALFGTQLVHGLTPAETSSEGYVGTVVGGLLLIASAVAIYALRAGLPWAARLTGITGLVVAVGFVAYHATPLKSPVTNPYIGEPAGVPAWISVALSVAAGAWAAYEGLTRAAAIASA
jgi:hypothetical protein